MRLYQKYRIYALVVVVMLFLMALQFLRIQRSETPPPKIKLDMGQLQENCKTSSWISDGSYLEKIKSLVRDNMIIISVVDSGFLDMAINFYLTSIKPFKITNFIMLSIDNGTCSELTPYGINCALYHDFNLAKGASQYATTEFRRKMDVRAELMQRVLCQGYTVLHVDTDLYFYSNPLDDIRCPRETCHMAALVDFKEYNAGFILLHANKYSLYLYQRMRELTETQPNLAEQKRLTQVLKDLNQTQPEFRINGLSNEKYMYGKLFYTVRKYWDTAPECPQCIVIHNNWIVGKNEKILRAKEMHQWMLDKDGYYSSTTNKYLTYPNPVPDSDTPETDQLRLLKAALSIGHVLDRIVILPKFYCGGVECTLLELTSITELDSEFGGLYREHGFLSHPLLPHNVKQSVTTSSLHVPRHVTDTWLVQHFSHLKESVLVLQNICEEVEFTKDISRRLERITSKHKEPAEKPFWLWKALGLK